MMMPRSAAHAAPRGVELERDVARPRGEVRADELGGLLERDVLVVVADLGLGRGREHRLGELRRLQQSLRQPLAVHGPVGAVLLPGRAGDVAADDALDRQHLGAAAQHDAAAQLGLLRGLGQTLSEVEMRWLPTTPSRCSNQKADIAVSTRPLSGIGSAITTSNAEIRSDVTISRRPSPTS